MNAAATVCDGCWKRGWCERPRTCRCTCDGGRFWHHADRECVCGLQHRRGTCDGGR